MQGRTQTVVARDLARLRQQLAQFDQFLLRQAPAALLADMDSACEAVITEAFGEVSQFLEAYAYAKLGEAASLMNLQEEAQENGAQDIDRETMHQRRRVLEMCISALESQQI